MQSAKGPNKCSAKLVLTLRKCVVCNQEGRQMVALVFEDHNSVGGLFNSYYYVDASQIRTDVVAPLL